MFADGFSTARIAHAINCGRDFLERRIKDCPGLRDLPRRGRGFGGGRPRGGIEIPIDEIYARAAAIRATWDEATRLDRMR